MIGRPVVAERGEERAQRVEVLLGLGVMVQRRENARNALGRRGRGKPGEEIRAFAGVTEARGEEPIECRERVGRGRGFEIPGSFGERTREAFVDRRGECGGAFGREPLGDVLHRRQELRGDVARGQYCAKIRELRGRARVEIVGHA